MGLFQGQHRTTRPSGRGISAIKLGVESMESRQVPASLVAGGIVVDSIARPAEVDTWTHTGKKGDRIELITTSTPGQAGFLATTKVYDPGGKYLGKFGQSENKPLTLERDGTYQFKVSDDDSAQTGSYSIGLETLVPVSPDAKALTVGGIVGGSVDNRIEKDLWTFRGKKGDRVELITTSTSGVAGFQAEARLFDPSGKYLGKFNPGENTPRTLDADGTYVVMIHDNDFAQTGSYSIGLETLVPVSPDAKALTVGGIVGGSVDNRIEKDLWTFRGKKGDRVELITTSTSGVAGFQAEARLFDPSGKYLGKFNPGENTPRTLDADGTYVVMIHDNDFAQTGSYSIGLESITPTSPDARTLRLGTDASGSIAAALQKDQWRVQVVEGRKLRVTLNGTANDSGFAVYADIYSASGSRVGSFGSGTSMTGTLAAGTYTIQIRDRGFLKRGGYRVNASLV